MLTARRNVIDFFAWLEDSSRHLALRYTSQNRLSRFVNLDFFVVVARSTRKHMTTIRKPDFLAVLDLKKSWFFCNLNLVRKDVAEVDLIRMCN